MTDTLRINAGNKRVLINDGPDFIEFNPTDVVFVEKFYNTLGEFEAKLADYEKRAEGLDKGDEVDVNGLPKDLEAKFAFIHEVSDFMKGKIDFLFGVGTSQKLFGAVESLDMFEQFFTGLTPFIKGARSEKVSKYAGGKNQCKVMK